MVASKEVLHCEHAGQPLCVRECNGIGRWRGEENSGE